jgi:hypothetical protein
MSTSKDTIARMKKALAQGRMIYNTGRTAGRGKHPVYEQLSEDGRKLMGLTPLAEIIPNWQELLPTAEEAQVLRQKALAARGNQ